MHQLGVGDAEGPCSKRAEPTVYPTSGGGLCSSLISWGSGPPICGSICRSELNQDTGRVEMRTGVDAETGWSGVTVSLAGYNSC